MRVSLNTTLRVGAALSMLAAVTVTALAWHEYTRGKDRYQLEYTRATKERDIADTAGNAFSALQRAELSAQDYILTGETAYSEAYTKAIRDWQDESATAGLVSQRNASAPLVQDLLRSGTRVLNELAQIVDLYDAKSADAALTRVRKGAAFVYLEQGHDSVEQILEIAGQGANRADRAFVTRAFDVQRRLLEAAVCLLFFTVIGMTAVILTSYRVQRADLGLQTSGKPSVATAG